MASNATEAVTLVVQGSRADVGFRDSYVEPLAGPESMVVAIK